MPEPLLIEDLKCLVGKTCLLKESQNNAFHEIEVLKVTPLKKRSGEGHPAPFVVEVRCGKEMPQQMFRIFGGGLETRDIFFSPVKREPRGILYEAVFN